MFSVIIPLHNKAAYVEKAIRSVLSQTFQEFELIVVNDGSTDESLKNLQFTIYNLQLPEEKIRIIEQQNQGVSIARNNGVKEAKYDYIAFLDSDDSWEPTYLEEMKALIETYPDAGIYGSSYYLVKNGQKRKAPIGVESDFEKGMINYCQVYAKTLCMPLWTGATIIRKTIFESKKGFKPNLKLGEDFDLWVRVAMKYPVVLLNKPLANYNQDVELSGRAIGEKLYEPLEHMLFSNYSELNKDIYFRYLYERLAVYGLLPYYVAEKNKRETNDILSGINWKQHAFKYSLYYRILPKALVKSWFWLQKRGSQMKNKIHSHNEK